MTYRCLAEFLEDLDNTGELTRVDEAGDLATEMTKMSPTADISAANAVLSASPKGSNLPVLCNLLGTEPRICRTLGVTDLDEAADRVGRMFDAAAPESWFERLRGNQPTGLANFSPKTVRAAACQQIVRIGGDIHLAELPLLQASPATDVSVIPSSPVLTTEPDSHQPTLARFDLHRLDDGRLAVGWAAHDEHARLWMAYRQRNQKMPLAVIIGGDPAFLLAASAPLPPGSDVCAVAGLLREKSLDVVACRSVDLEVPAEAEIVLEGFVDPAEPLVSAGPFCGPMGSLTHPWRAPVMHVTAVTHRANPLFVAMKPGRPPNEAVTVARAMHRVFRPLARLAIPELVDYNLPEFGAARYWAAVSIQKTYPGQGRRAALAAWNLPAMLFAKMLVVVDDDVDVHDHARVLAAMTEHVRPDRDVWTEKGPADPFDPTVPPGSLSVKMAFDATRKMGAE